MKNRLSGKANNILHVRFTPTLNGNYHLSMTHKAEFNDPARLEAYVAAKGRHKKRLVYFQRELQILDDKISSSGSRTPDLWGKLMKLVHQMMEPEYYCYGYFEKEVLDLARAILSR